MCQMLLFGHTYGGTHDEGEREALTSKDWVEMVRRSLPVPSSQLAMRVREGLRGRNVSPSLHLYSCALKLKTTVLNHSMSVARTSLCNILELFMLAVSPLHN